MIEKVLHAAAAAVRRAFPEATVYLDAVEQGLEAPCFCLCCAKPRMRRFLGERWRCSLPVTLYCFPGSDEKNSELNGVFDRLFAAMEVIDCEGPLRGGNMQADISDGVGVFRVDYDFFCSYKEAQEDEGSDVMLELLLEG